VITFVLPSGSRPRSKQKRETTMNFAQLLTLFEQRGHDRNAIAMAMHMSLAQIDAWQSEAERLANEMIVDTGGHRNI
jgi:hypothetical protein